MSDVEELGQSIIDDQNSARSRAMQDIDADPEPAARSIELGEDTGAPSGAIHANLEQFEKNYKSQLTSQLLKNNPYLVEYANSHPLATKVSANDWHNLDEASEKMQQLPNPKRQLGKDIGQGIMHLPGDFADILTESGKSLGAIPKDITQWTIPANEVRNAMDAVRKEGPTYHNIAQLIGSISNAAMGPAMAPGLQQFGQYVPVTVGAQDLVGGLFGIASSPFMAPIRSFLSRPIEEKSGIPQEFTEQIAMLGMMFMGLREGKAHVHGGEIPPPGVSKETDAIREFRSKENLKALDEATKSTQGTQTNQLSPDLGKQFAGQHVEDRSVYVSADAIRKLYGDKPPTSDDGLLGFIPGLADQISAHADVGGDVAIPLKDWLTKVDPEIAKALHDDIRVTKDDVTTNEAKRYKELQPEEKPGVQNIDLSRRGFLKGVGATVATAATAKVPKLGEVTQAVTEGLKSDSVWGPGELMRMHTEAALRTASEDLDLPIKSPEVRKLAIEKLQRQVDYWKDYEGVNQYKDYANMYREGIDLAKSGFAEGLKEYPSEVEAGEAKPILPDVSTLPEPEEYMKGPYPTGLIEPSPRSAVRRHQEAIDEVRDAAKLNPSFAKSREVNLKITDTFDQPEFEDQSGNKHPAGKLIDIDLTGPDEEPLGSISVATGGDFLHVDYAHNAEFQPWQHGMNQMEVLLRTAKELYLMFPETKGLGGHLISRDKYVKYTWDQLFSPGTSDIGISDLKEKYLNPPFELGPSRPTGVIQSAKGKRFTTDSLGSTTIRSAFEQMDLSKSVGGPIAGALDPIAKKIVEKVGNVQVHVIKQPEWYAMQEGVNSAAFYDPISNVIAISENEFNGGFQASRVFFHEAIHAATVREIIRNPALDNNIQFIMNDITDKITGKHYGMTDTREFIAEALSNPVFQRELAGIQISPKIAEMLRVRPQSIVKTMWDAIIHTIAKGLGLADTPDVVTAFEAAIRVSQEAFDKQLTIYDRVKMLEWKMHLAASEEAPKPSPMESELPSSAEPTAFRGKAPGIAPMAKQPELPGMTRMEDRKAFATPTALGINKEWYQKYQDLIAKQQGEDAKRRMEVALRRAEQIQTKEWKDNSDRISKEVEDSIRQRPDIAVDEALRKGSLGEGTAQKGGRRLRLKADELTEEQKGVLDRSEYSTDGVDPDDLAGYFGYPSGDAMLERLGQLRQHVAATYASTEAFIKAITREETARRMEQEFGDLGANILEEARDHITSDTQLDLMHEELVGAAMQAGIEFSITKDQMKAIAKASFDKHTMGDMSAATYLKLAGKHGMEMEKAALDEDWKTVFKAKQMQTLATMMAQEATKVEKAKKGWDRNAKTYAKRKVSGIDPQYMAPIHDIMFRTGATPKPRRSLEDLANQYRLDGRDRNAPLADFVKDRQENFRTVEVPDWLQDPRFQKEFDSLTSKEFMEAHRAIRSLIKEGRNEQKVFSGGEGADLVNVLDTFRENISDLPIQETQVDRPRSVSTLAKTLFWMHVNVESMLNRLDKGIPDGPFKKYIMFPIASAMNTKAAMLKEFQHKLADLGKIKDMDKLVENNLWLDPRTGEPLVLRKRNVLGILQQVGNKSSFEKLTKGHNIEPDQAMDWLRRNTTKEDWDRAQKIGDLFKELFTRAERMQHNLTGIAPVKVKLEPFTDPFGVKRDGWYNPVAYDRRMPQNSPKLIGKGVEEDGYFRATTPQGFLEERTGYIGPTELSLDIVPVRMKQMIHDITMRPAVIQASKFFYNKEFNAMIRKHFGDVAVEEFVPFLRDVANSANYRSFAEYVGNQGLEFVRQNMIGTLIGWNPGTVLKHGTTALFNSLQQMGYRDFGLEFVRLLKKDDTTGERNWTMARTKSEEIQRRLQNFRDAVAGGEAELHLKGGPKGGVFMSAREVMSYVHAFPVAAFDLLSTIPTWLVAYKRGITSHGIEGKAIEEADLAVRQTHGSFALSNKPSIMRSKNAFVNSAASLYGFFSHIFQKQYEMAWRAKDAVSDFKQGEIKQGFKGMKTASSLFFSYVILPAVIEEMVTPYTNEEKDSWGAKAIKTIGYGLSSSTIGLRDFVHALINVRDPQAGLVGTMMKTIADVGHDFGRGSKMFEGDKAGRAVSHFLSLIGMTTGLTNQTEGHIAEYLTRLGQKRERAPQGPWEAAVGARYGRTKGHSKTAAEYMKHLQGR
jgi:hypothetical protein